VFGSVAEFLTAEISASAIRWNLSLLRELLAPGTKLCAVVKANCYGHGIKQLLGLFDKLVDYLAVASAEEALELRMLGFARDILVFLPSVTVNAAVGDELLDEMISRQVTLTVISTNELVPIQRAAARLAAGELKVSGTFFGRIKGVREN